jgi:uncharacterized protein (DUF1810 family)
MNRNEAAIHPNVRHRGVYATLVAVVIGLGLASRSGALSPFFAKYTGDALWALMIFLSVGFLLPTWRTASVGAIALTVTCSVEFSQFYHAPWIDVVRFTTLGHLVLGDTFAWGDMVAYLAGIALGGTKEAIAKRIKCRVAVPPAVILGSPQMDDPFCLMRFLNVQETDFAQALSEIKAGQKRSHWMWYIFPQYDGLGFSTTAKLYAIKSLQEAKAYLAHPILGPRLIECADAVLGVEGRTAHQIFGSPDDLKLKSSATLFAQVSSSGSVFERLLAKYYQGESDQKTLLLLGAKSNKTNP